MKGEHTHDHISKQISCKLYEFLWCILWTYRRKIYYTLKEVEVGILTRILSRVVVQIRITGDRRKI